MKGRKDDHQKDRWDLLPYPSVKDVVKVLTFGARKYDDDNWQHVKNPKKRYFAAAMRHMVDWKAGVKKDKESGLSPLAHAACCLLFLMWFDMKGK